MKADSWKTHGANRLLKVVVASLVFLALLVVGMVFNAWVASSSPSLPLLAEEGKQPSPRQEEGIAKRPATQQEDGGRGMTADPDETRLWAEFARAPDQAQRFLVYFRDQPDLSPAHAMNSRTERGAYVYDALRRNAARSQAGALALLSARALDEGFPARLLGSLWICNALVVEGDESVARALAARPEVARLALDELRQYLPAPADSVQTVDPVGARPFSSEAITLEWNLTQIGADQVWSELGVDGQGVVVANIDTGVLFDHPALLAHYRGNLDGVYEHNYNWYDTTDTYPNAPDDGHSHGTHTMGTLVGSTPNHVVGVAPGARWIAVKGLSDWGFGSTSQIHAAFQWVLAPTDLNGENPDPSRAPHVVNNSWGVDNGALDTYHQDIEMLIAAGIVPVFSAGNQGPAEGTIGSPASFDKAMAVGALDAENYVAYFSSRGPSPLTSATKPEVAAPGVDINSSWIDGGYRAKSGTSMAAPHVAGVVALMLQANPQLDYDQVRTVITDTARDLGEAGPDYHYGWGMLDAYAAVDAVQSLGRMRGQVRDQATGAGIDSAVLTAEGQDLVHIRQTVVDAQGYYTLLLPIGTYTVTVTAFGYYSTAATVAIPSQEEPVWRDFVLAARPRHRLTGRVTDAVSGAPLSATLTLLDVLAEPATTDPATGAYQMDVPQGVYTLEADSFGYVAERRVITVSRDLTEDFALIPLPPILLVDDDGGADDQLVWETNLNALGQDYQLWNTLAWGTPPGRYLAEFPIVLWTTGLDKQNHLLYAEQEAMMTYLDSGGSLWLSSPSYPNNKRQSLLMPHYLHIQPIKYAVTTDAIVGVDASPIGAWMGAISITIPSYYAYAVEADALATPAFTALGQVIATTYHERATWYRAAFFSVALEALDPAGAQALLHRVLRWFRQGQAHGDLVGRVDAQDTGEPLPGVDVVADGIWDGYALTSNAGGHYTFTLMTGDYQLIASRPGYFTVTVPDLSVLTDTVTTQAVSLTPQVTLSPTILAHSLVAGESWTTMLFVNNAGASPFYYGSYEQDFWQRIADVTATLRVPLSELTPTVDGHYVPGEWEDASVVFLTPLDEPGGAEVGQALVKQAAGNLYVLLDYEGQISVAAKIKGQVRFDRDGDGEEDAIFYARVVDDALYTDFSHPAQAAADMSSTPGDANQHWIFEFEIPLKTAGLAPGGLYHAYFYLYDSWLGQGGEWGNVTPGVDVDDPSLWETIYLNLDRVPWLRRYPVGGYVDAQVTHTLEITFDGRLAQPGQHAAELVLSSRHQFYPLVRPAVGLSLTVAPAPDMGRLSGAIADARTGRPLIATVAEVGGLAVVPTDPTDGSYAIWLTEGTRELEILAEGYLPRYLTIDFSAGMSATRHITLQFDGPELVLIPSLDLFVNHGDTVLAELIVGNQGPRPLEFQILETTAEVDLPADAARVKPEAGAWSQETFSLEVPQPWLGLLEEEARGPTEMLFPSGSLAQSFTGVPLGPFLFDSVGEGENMTVDLVRGDAAVDRDMLYLRLTFSDTSDLWHTVGYIHLDTDRITETGRLPSTLLGKRDQDIGFDYYLNLFAMPWAREIDLWRADGQYVGTVPGRWQANALEWGVPLAWLGSVDGVMDVTMVLGDQSSAIDWGPAQGHSTVGLGANWLVESPDQGVVAAPYSGTLALPGTEAVTVSLLLDGGGLQPGVHSIRLAVFSNDPVSPTVYLPLTVTVAPAPGMHQVVGRVVDCTCLRRTYALVYAEGDENVYTYTDRQSGAYELWLMPGTWNLRAFTPGETQTRLVTIDANTPEPLRLDFVLGECSLYLPAVFKQ